MANPLRGEASLIAGDATYTLSLHINALCEAEDALGMDIDEILSRYAGGASMRVTRALIWAGLQDKHPCSIDQAGDIMTAAGVPAAKASLEKALISAMPPEEGGKSDPPKRGKGGTG